MSALTFLLITTETKSIYKLPLAEVTYPEKNLRHFLKLKEAEKVKKVTISKRHKIKNTTEQENISVSNNAVDLEKCIIVDDKKIETC